MGVLAAARRRSIFAAAAVIALVCAGMATVSAELVPVRYPAATARAHLTLSTMDGRSLAAGEQIQTAEGNRVTKRLTFRFRDGSLDDEETTFSQQGSLRLISYHHIQRGPSFPHPMTMSIDVARGQVTTQYVDGEGHPETDQTRITLPADVSNGMIVDVLENRGGSAQPFSVSYIATTPKPRVIELKIRRVSNGMVSAAGEMQQAIRYDIAVHIGGLEGVIGAWTGKIVPDSHVWIAEGAPAFVKSETVLSAATPLWRIEPTAPLAAATR